MTIGPDKMSHKQKRQNTQSPGKEGKDLKTSHKSQKLWCVGGAKASWLLNLAHLGPRYQIKKIIIIRVKRHWNFANKCHHFLLQ